MTGHEINPFQELYVTDSPDPNVFVKLFSDIPIIHSQILFRPGNVILKGTQGSGKSMLLNLFRPNIRIAYFKAKEEFPVPNKFSKFIGAGINLTRSGALDIGQISLKENIEKQQEIFPLLFADFLNYYIVRDILLTIENMAKNNTVFSNIVEKTKLDKFSKIVSKEPCWFDVLNPCDNFNMLCKKIDNRIESYRNFHMLNKELPSEIISTKTDIGEPIAKTAECLKIAKVISDDIPFFIRIDQVERLYGSDIIRPDIGKQYRRIINKALGKRDQRVSYRIGTRRYAWDDDLTIYGTSDVLEHIRDFRICDLDDILKRKEDKKTWIFPEFAEDAFRRRVSSEYDNLPEGNLIKFIFGGKKSPAKAAEYYAGTGKSKKILRYDKDWPSEWKIFLNTLFNDSKLEAFLAAAWARQRGNRGKAGWRLKESPPSDKKPWNRTYWRKERIKQALLQIAARNQQRLQWCGKEQIISLSSGNISIFLSICHEIWESHLRFQRYKNQNERIDPISDNEEIEPEIQAVGIHAASSEWYDKINEHPMGHYHQAFVDILGRKFRNWLLNDISLSYPGHNGFSMEKDELQKYPKIKKFLDNAVDFGDLYEMVHTTKEKNRKPRKKWYLRPILSVYFQIPEAHVKEPYYVKNISELIQWMKEAELPNFLFESEAIYKKKEKKNKTEPYYKQTYLNFRKLS